MELYFVYVSQQKVLIYQECQALC